MLLKKKINLMDLTVFGVLNADIDECAVPSACAKGQICGNTVGSFKCSCAFGFILDPETEQCTGELLHENNAQVSCYTRTMHR